MRKKKQRGKKEAKRNQKEIPSYLRNQEVWKNVMQSGASEGLRVKSEVLDLKSKRISNQLTCQVTVEGENFILPG